MKNHNRIVDFNIPPVVGDELFYIKQVIDAHRICGDGEFTRKCSDWLETKFNAQKVLLTTSGTSALDMAMQLCDIQAGDEVILPSYTFSSTATAAVMAGAKLVFVDIRRDTMNIDEKIIEEAITDYTKAIVVVHYAGVSCEMDTIMHIAQKHGLFVIEDAAQGVMSTYKGKALGTIGDFGCYSFHETKNYSMGEGGALLIKHEEYNERAEILREKGTNRSRFYRGQVDKYTWVDIGDSYLPSELNAAYLWAQLQKADEINEDRRRQWSFYQEQLETFLSEREIDLPFIPDGCEHNGHMFYLKCRNLEERSKLIEYLRCKGICTVFHYIPLHSSPAGMRYGRLYGVDVNTTKESERLVRLPLYYGLKEEDQQYVIDEIRCFYNREMC